jgi:hypothetical protein
MPIRIRITTRGTTRSPEEFIGSVEQTFSSENITRDLLATKNIILDRLSTFLDSHRKREIEEHTEYWRTTARNNLYHSIAEGTNIEQLGNNRYRLGIGRLKFLNAHSPYWFALNYGRKFSGGAFIPPPTKGYFGRGVAPGQGKGEVFHHARTIPGSYGKRTSAYLMIPQKPISPMYYLNDMVRNMRIEMKKLETKYRKEIRERKAYKARSKAAQLAREAIIPLPNEE